nr:FAD synthetase 2, chloroplastic-like isoform X2 [Nicotiana tomentosiformis]
MLGGSRCISQHLRDTNFHQFCTSTTPIFTAASPPISTSSFTYFRFRLRNKVSDFGVSCVQPNSSNTQSSLLSQTLSQSGKDEEPPSERLSMLAGGIVALGKFDALHIGHRELAIQAAKRGIPFLLSFVGMAEVLGWEPRAPIVADCDRKRILSSWAPYCGNVIPREFQIKFSKVRSLTPRQFVEKLSKELGVRGVVAGENYRFGYRASGDASDLVKLCKEYGLEAYIINSVMDKNQISGDLNSREKKERGQVSSTRVRYALDKGDMKYVSELLGRNHRLVLLMEDQERFISEKNRLSAPKSCLLNLAPKEGLYENCSVSIDENVVPCRVTVNTTDIHLECYEKIKLVFKIQTFIKDRSCYGTLIDRVINFRSLKNMMNFCL